MSLVPTTPERNRELGVIHSMARSLGMTDFQRRALQYDVTGHDSCLLMTAEERRMVIAELEREAALKHQPQPPVSDEEALAILS